MPVAKQAEIKPAEGKLGVLLVGLGAVSTTFIAGVEAIKKGFAEPIGSLTQMGPIRLGKRTDNRVPLIKDLVPLADLKDLVFGAWDIFESNCYEAARTAGVLEPALLEQIRPDLEAVRPWPAKVLVAPGSRRFLALIDWSGAGWLRRCPRRARSNWRRGPAVTWDCHVPGWQCVA